MTDSQINDECIKYNLDNLQIKNERKLFFFRIIDSHIYFELFKKIKVALKFKTKFPYQKVTDYGVTVEKRSPQLIVSLTSFPGRIDSVEKTINTLLNQTLKPDRVILWLAESQFANKENDLPAGLLKLKELGLEIKWCEDLKPYKKLVPALKEFPNDIIVTADDDLYYQKDWLEELYNAYKKDNSCIYTRGAAHLDIKGDNISVLPYRANYNYKPSFANVLMGGSGTLFPPHSLHPDVLNEEKILNFIPTQDDIYFWAMAVLNKTKICYLKSKNMNMYQRENTRKSGLCKINNTNGSGMSPFEAYKKVFIEYPEIYSLITEEKCDE